MTETDPQVDWADWLRRWDAQQQGYVPQREARFAAMLDALAGLLPQEFVAVDLACGPGSISQRLLTRFPGSRAIAVDVDPMMLAVGRGALGTMDGRLRWVQADVATAEWVQAVGEERVDAVLSSTALHWLGMDVTRVYGEIAGLLRPGGVLLNADNLAFGDELPTVERWSHRVMDEQWSDDAFAEAGIETAEQWWEAAAAEAAFAPLLEQRAQAFAGKQRPGSVPDFRGHVAALRAAGFTEVTTIWQVLSDRVLLAVR